MDGIVVRNSQSGKGPRLIRLPEYLGGELAWGDDKSPYAVFASEAEAIRELREMKDMGGYCPPIVVLEFLPSPPRESGLTSLIAEELENISALLTEEV